MDEVEAFAVVNELRRLRDSLNTASNFLNARDAKAAFAWVEAIEVELDAVVDRLRELLPDATQ